MNLLFIFKQDSRSLKFNIKKYDELKKTKLSTTNISDSTVKMLI